uniref:Uncharacterized protein n=1 Tax=Rhizophora mucronata TaxID=61149 RepID=A0A2P2QUX0_RHIMU
MLQSTQEPLFYVLGTGLKISRQCLLRCHPRLF